MKTCDRLIEMLKKKIQYFFGVEIFINHSRNSLVSCL